MASVAYSEVTAEIIRAAGFRPDPEQYVGSEGASSHIRVRHLQTLYREIRDRICLEAARNFVRVIEEMRVIRINAILCGLWGLQYHGWNWGPKVEESISIGAGVGSDATAFVAFAAALTASPNQDTSAHLRSQFLANPSGE